MIMLRLRQKWVYTTSATLLAFGIFSCSSNGPSRQAQGYINFNGGRLYYEQQGNGQAVVLVGGGSAMDSRQWDAQSDFLKGQFRVVKVDPRAIGRSGLPTTSFSNAEDLKAVLDSLEIDRATIVGLSYSGGIALEFALLYPQRVCGLVCAGPLVPGWQFSKSQQKRMADFGAAMQEGPSKFVEVAFADPHFMPAPRNPEARDLARALIGTDEFRSFDPSLMRKLDPPVVDRISQITAPTLLIAGALDHEDIHNRVQFLNNYILNSQRIIIEESGHTVNLERPEEFSRLVRDFLENLDCN
jgi:pimeloyl-ACP methyl ester carboxylesterase